MSSLLLGEISKPPNLSGPPSDGARHHANWKLNSGQNAKPSVAIGHYMSRSTNIAGELFAVPDR
jgi:hypothetical protein